MAFVCKFYALPKNIYLGLIIFCRALVAVVGLIKFEPRVDVVASLDFEMLADGGEILLRNDEIVLAVGSFVVAVEMGGLRSD